MEQITQYLYEYQNGKRMRNIGFMKIEKQLDKYLIQIYAKNMDDIQGILFQKENGERYIGGWEAEMLPVEEPSVVVPEQPAMPPQQTTIPQEQPPATVMPVMQETAPAPVIQGPKEIASYIPPSNITYEKIQRQDISRFPRKEWRIANNSFLLHGYHNYHHLLYIEEDGKVWLGVPGIFHEKEQIAAKSFGFPEFRRLTDTDLQLEESEKNTYEDFGYWCRQIPVS